MTDKNEVPEKTETFDPKNDIEYIKLVYDFKMKVVTESINNLVKGLPIYLTILAVLIGYFFTRESSDESKKYLVFIGICASVSVIITYSIITKTIIAGISSIQQTLEKSNSNLFKELQVERFISRMKKSVLVSLIIVSLFTLILVLGLILYVKR